MSASEQTRVSAEEMAWREYLAQALESEMMMQKFELMTHTPRPKAPGSDDMDVIIPWAMQYRRWLVAYRRWLATRYGWNRVPAWLVDETTRGESAA